MSNWWELSEEEIAEDSEARTERAADYFNSFYAEDGSKHVLMDIEKICYKRKADSEATLATIELFHQLKKRAGITITGEMSALSAEADSLR